MATANGFAGHPSASLVVAPSRRTTYFFNPKGLPVCWCYFLLPSAATSSVKPDNSGIWPIGARLHAHCVRSKPSQSNERAVHLGHSQRIALAVGEQGGSPAMHEAIAKLIFSDGRNLPAGTSERCRAAQVGGAG